MAKRFRGGKAGKGGKGGRGGRGSHYSGQRADYKQVDKTNETFERYYNELGVVDSGEREAFWDALRRDLPNSFRFTGSKGHALSVQQRLKDHYVPEITSMNFDDGPVVPPSQISWFPEQLAWSMTTPKSVVRKFPPFASFQRFLVSETSVGNISRQEVVSMIPPLLMDIKPGMTVLDMCAAPGSKAAQLIEIVHGGEEARVRKVLHKMAEQEGREISPDGAEIEADIDMIDAEGDWSDDGRTTGLLIANDADAKRSHMLIHQMKRLNSPNLIVMNHDATLFPSIKLPSDPVSEGQPLRNKYLKFDRILADVPCSGDGTCRKNPNIWKDWLPGNGLGLYITQVRILVRALQMLKVGGRVVYSTCSMNPVENEAVISSAIERCGGLSHVTLVDCSDALPGLQRRPGLKTWQIMDKQGRIWKSWKGVEEQRKVEGIEGLGKLVEGMFPPNSLREGQSMGSENIPFERCMRIYGHLQDTGGFFIAVLQKKSEIKARPESESRKFEPKPSIIAAVDELAAKPVNGTNVAEKINALDGLVPPGPQKEAENPSATARQNKENAPQGELSTTKHALDDEADAEMQTKRIKTRDEVDEAAPRGEEDRQVHFPPPPGAQLGITRPDQATPPPEKKKSNQPYEEPFKYLSPNHEELNIISEYYNISSRFPRDRFMVRNPTGEPVKAIYYTSALAREILTENEGKGMKFVHSGVKIFVKQDVQKAEVCRWRIQNEGLPILEAWVGEERVVRLYKRETLRKLLIEMFPKVAGGGWEELGEIGERVRDIGMGCCVLRIETSDGDDGFRERMVLPLWRSLHSLNLMLPKEDRKALLLRLYNDSTPLMDHSKDRFKNDNGHALEPESPELPALAPPEEDSISFEDDKMVIPGLGRSEEAAIEVEDATASKIEDEASKEVEIAAGVRDELNTSNITV
ncbi:MAG: hypothetical protein M1827_005663 [Pycnora praestabilis]|nr:MAG: hypothetical protein M1827_005663 [Pycnora praestabilis]